MVEDDEDARIERKFDTMLDMMSRLLGKMEQQSNNDTNYQRNEAEHNGSN